MTNFIVGTLLGYIMGAASVLLVMALILQAVTQNSGKVWRFLSSRYREAMGVGE